MSRLLSRGSSSSSDSSVVEHSPSDFPLLRRDASELSASGLEAAGDLLDMNNTEWFNSIMRNEISEEEEEKALNNMPDEIAKILKNMVENKSRRRDNTDTQKKNNDLITEKEIAEFLTKLEDGEMPPPNVDVAAAAAAVAAAEEAAAAAVEAAAKAEVEAVPDGDEAAAMDGLSERKAAAMDGLSEAQKNLLVAEILAGGFQIVRPQTAAMAMDGPQPGSMIVPPPPPGRMGAPAAMAMDGLPPPGGMGASAAPAPDEEIIEVSGLRVIVPSSHKGLLDDIDTEFNDLIRDIANSGIDRVCGFFMRKLLRLLNLILKALALGLGFAIKWPKLSLIILLFLYLQSSTCAFIIKGALVLIGRTLKILLGMTTAGQKIFAFIAKIGKIIEWCNTVGVDGIAAGYDSFNQLVEAVNNISSQVDTIVDNMNKIKEWADSIGISPEDLIQIILSMQNAGFGGQSPSSPMTEAMWRMLTGIVPVAFQAVLGAQPGRAPQDLLRMGGSKKKRKNRKRKKTLRKQKKTRRKYKKSNKKSKRK